MWEKKPRYERHVPKGEIIFKEGDLGEEMYFIRKGKVKISKGEEANEKVLAILKDGDFFGEMALIDGSPRSATATAIEDTDLLIIDKESFTAKINENPLIAYVMEVLTKRLRTCDEKLKYLSIRNDEHRIIRYLINRAQEKGENEDVLLTGESIDKIAEITSVDVSKVEDQLKRLEAIGMIKRDPDGSYRIKNVNELNEYLKYLELKDRFKV